MGEAEDGDASVPLALKRQRRESSKTASCVEPNEAEVSRDDAKSGVRRSGRVTVKELPIDTIATHQAPVPGANGFTYSLGGADTGGAEAERILKEVEMDDSLLGLRAQFSGCRKVVLYGRDGRAVAAAVVELLAPPANVFEIPLHAATRSARGHGYGSLLFGLLMELAAMLRAKFIVVSSTDESRRFWLSQGLHALQHCQSANA